MKNTFTRFLFTSLAVLFLSNVYAQFPTIYASIASGSWASTTTWETFTGNATGTPGGQGTGTAAISVPSGTHYVYIRAGHTITMGGANRSCYSMTIEPTAKLWADESASRRLQLVNGGTGFLYPQSGTITNNGIIGGVGDGMFFETGTNCQNATLTGTGVYYIRRIRMPGGIGSANGGVVNLIIDQNITLDTANNYALSAAYNSAVTDNYSVTINAGKIVTLANPSTYFHSNSATVGNYTYNINGTLDLSASVQTSQYLTALSPGGGTVNLNINGALNTGAAFNSSPVAPGAANITVATGVTVDATRATVMNFNGNVFALQNAAALKRTVPNDGTRIEFPIGIYNPTGLPSQNSVAINGTTGPVEIFTATVKSTFTNPTPTNTLPREWGINETTAGGNEDTLRFSWTAGDQGASGFSSAGTVFIIRWNGTTWDYKVAQISGTGTIADPFIAKGTGFTNFGFFALTNTFPTPVKFTDVRVSQKSSGIEVDFSNASELDVINYVIERSVDGNNFTSVATLKPKTNNGSLNSYTYMDITASRGNNFYRIKGIETNGHEIYSAIVKLNTNGIKAGLNIYPNPVKNNNFSAQLENLDKGVYTVSLINKLGQVIYSKQVNNQGGSSTLVIEMPSAAGKGVYSLQVTNASFKTAKNIIVE